MGIVAEVEGHMCKCKQQNLTSRDETGDETRIDAGLAFRPALCIA